MKTYNNLYKELCSEENILLAYKKAKKGKSKKKSVLEFERNLEYELQNLRQELSSKTYEPKPLKRFVVRDPKTRIIHASTFRDRIVHHLIVGAISPIFEKIFIFDSYASRIGKGTHSAIKRFDHFKRKVSRNGKLVKNSKNSNSVEGYVFKADIKHYFDTVDHEILIKIIKEKIKDEELIWLIGKILKNFDSPVKGAGMPLGNYTSQFFANVYLNKLDYLAKHELKAKYYLRYVDDFVILHRSKKRLEHFKKKITHYLRELKLDISSR
jgi:RNA-directed DNA polymerase